MRARPEDVVFARHVLEKGYATETQIQECLKLLARLRGEMDLDETLGNVLLKKGYLSQAQLRALERILDPTPSTDRKNAIPGYRLLERIGVGAMGAVYKAHHLKLDIPVAIKVLRTSLSSSQTQVERLKREAQLVARLTHPNIVVSRDVGEADGIHYLAMEYVDGPTVRELLRGKTLPEKYALQVTREVARALEHAHEQGIIHRDVKPGNIMIAKDGRVKLADFGLARSKTPSDLTLEHASIGTPQYVAPEQMRRAGDARPRSDLFSLGATLYHMVTGQPPFDGENLGEIVQNVLACRFPPPETIRCDLSVDTLYVIHKLMRRDPRERYASATELLADLERIERGERVAPATFHGDQQAYLRRKRMRAAAVAVAVVVTVAAVAFVAASRVRKNRAEAARAQACRELDAMGGDALAGAATVGRLRDTAAELRAAFDGPHACRADEIAGLAQRLARVEADLARVDEAEAALRAAGKPGARFRELRATVGALRGAMHFEVARDHVAQVAEDILDRSRAAAKRRYTDVYFDTEYGHMGEARAALAALARELRERFATADRVEATARDAAAYGELVEAWRAAHDEWKESYEQARRNHRYAEAWAKYESFRAGCLRALDLVRDTDLSPQLLKFFEVVDDEAALADEERRHFRETVRAGAERALRAGDAAGAEKIVADFVRVAKVARVEAETLLETIRGRTSVRLAAQRKALALLEARIREALRQRAYGGIAAQVAAEERKRDWLPGVRAELDAWRARAGKLQAIRERYDGDDWAELGTAALLERLDFSDGRLGDPELRGHFRWAESYRVPDPRAAAELLRLALLDLDRLPWADELRERRQRILEGLPRREEEAKRLLELLQEAEARKDHVTALLHCRRLLDDGRDGLRYTDTVGAIADELDRKRKELVRRAGASEWREHAGLPNDPAHFVVDPESDVWRAVFDFRPWWPDEGREPAGVDRERWLAEKGKAYWYERFRTWDEPDEAAWPQLLERARHQLLLFSETLVPAPEGGAVLEQDYAAAWWPGDGAPRSFELAHPFRADAPWSVELVVRWEDPDGVHGAPGYFALGAGRAQAGVVYTPHRVPCGGRGALLFSSEAIVPDDLEEKLRPFRMRTLESRRRPRLGPEAAYGMDFGLEAGRDYRIRLSHEGAGVVRFALGPAQGKMRDIVTRDFKTPDAFLLPRGRHVFRFVSLTTCRILRAEMRGEPRDER